MGKRLRKNGFLFYLNTENFHKLNLYFFRELFVIQVSQVI